MRYFINSNCNNLSINWKKYVLYWKKWSFEPLSNSVHTTKYLPQPDNMWNENTSSASLHSTVITR